MILKAVELNVFPNKDGYGVDGRFYYNALDIKALKKDKDVLGINNHIIEDACNLTKMINPAFSNNGVVVYDNLIDLFSYTLNEDNNNQIIVGLKEMNIEVLKLFLEQLIDVISKEDVNIDFYLTIKGKVNQICANGKIIDRLEYEKILKEVEKFNKNNEDFEIELPKRDVKKQNNNNNIMDVIRQLKEKIKVKEKILEDLNKQIVEIESLLEESEFLDRQIIDSKKQLEDIGSIDIEDLL